MNQKLRDSLLEERNQLQHTIIMLENSDDRLHTDGNGNRETYKRAVERVRKIDGMLYRNDT